MSLFQKMIALSLLILSLAIAYYVAFYLPQKQNREWQLKISLIDFNTRQRTDCIQQTVSVASDNWNIACTARGLPNDCSLMPEIGGRVDKAKKEQQDLCLKLYPPN